MFFFNIASENQMDKDSFMKQKPYNDNLVMASIESLYEQASHINHPGKTGLQRHNPKNLPIIGSLPVQLGRAQEINRLDDIVLTGRFEAAFTHENHPAITTRQHRNERREDNPFLAIRQAVIAAGDEKNQVYKQPTLSKQAEPDPETPAKNTSETNLTSKLPAELDEQTFSAQLASLIVSEIDRRLAELTLDSQRPDRKNQKTGRKAKKKALARTAAKKSSTAKRKQPK